MYVLAVAAIIFYMSKIPERYFPGTVKFHISNFFSFHESRAVSLVKCDAEKERSCSEWWTKPKTTPALIKREPTSDKLINGLMLFL